MEGRGSRIYECVVVGAGPAGLGTAAMLKRASVEALVIERQPSLAPSWRARYDGFRLNTSSWFSHLPNSRFPKEAGRWPSRDALIRYYENYARDNGLELRLDTKVNRVVDVPDGWRLETAAGEVKARAVVIATGKYRTPIVPTWPGAHEFAGEVIHSDWYRNPAPYQGKRVLVVGAGASGFEIATQIAEGGAAQCWLSIRTPPHIIHRDIGPFPSDLFAGLSRRLPAGLVDAAGKLIRRVSIGDNRDPYTP